MATTIAYKNQALFAIGLLSVSIIAYQLVLMQILSIVQWYHFAYMVISVALLGFGAAGAFLSIYRCRLLLNFEWIFPLMMMMTGAAMAVVVGISQLSSIRFDSYLLFAEGTQVWRLLLTYFLFFIPFFTGALALGMVFVKFVEDIRKLYFANLLGSGIGGMVALGIIRAFLPEQLPAIVAVMPVVAGTLAISEKAKIQLTGAAILTAGVIVIAMTFPPELTLSQFKKFK